MQQLRWSGSRGRSAVRYVRKRPLATVRGCLSPVTVITVLWLCLIYWNERLVFTTALRQCAWERWEKWPVDSSPHRLALVADPQLVDPHTYPGRPWPLSTLTIKYTDLYLRRVHRILQSKLYPDTTVFLGDLFDGGREWSTGQSSSPEKQYRKYGESFWHQEYKRFSAIFYDTWREAGVSDRYGQLNRRRIITNIPGNHDLGFASGIQEPVRKRFNAYFGDGNALWLLGNHTVVSLDSVSLSAKEDDGATESIWRPTQDFLDGYKALRHRAMTMQAAQLAGQKSHSLMRHSVVEGADLSTATRLNLEHISAPSYPTILLSHVPLYRDKGTPCGPLREKWPQARDAHGVLLESDESNAITVARGYQYQNVLSPEISKEITSKLETISHAFSGDDHDYCEVVHRRYPSAGSGIVEITVKSISWAMGVRKPGIQLVSLWNPSSTSDSNQMASPQGTLQSQLCLLPDQLGLFLHYMFMLACTILVLSLRAGYFVANSNRALRENNSTTLLPTVQTSDSVRATQGQSSSSDEGGERSMTKRSKFGLQSMLATVSRSPSPRSSFSFGLPAPSASVYRHVQKQKSENGYIPGYKSLHATIFTAFTSRSTDSPHGITLFARELKSGILKVIVVVLPAYVWLIRRG